MQWRDGGGEDAAEHVHIAALALCMTPLPLAGVGSACGPGSKTHGTFAFVSVQLVVDGWQPVPPPQLNVRVRVGAKHDAAARDGIRSTESV